MKLEAGKTYVTRGGKTAQIGAINMDVRESKQAIGWFDGVVCSWRADGKFYGGFLDALCDIVAEAPPEEDAP